MPANQRGIGMVFQSYSLFPHLSVEGNVAFGLKIKGLTRDQIEIRVRSVLERVQLLALRDRFPHQLSGGQQQRVALARALAIEPNVLLLDEPLSALDAKVRHELRTEIRRLQTEAGVATLFVTHDQEEAMAISDRIVVMNNGVVQQIGTPVEVYMSPNNSFVARFVGAMNELTVTVMDSRMVSLFGQEHALGASARHGERLTVLVRPDAVRIVPHEAVGSIPASVSEVVFAGSATVVRCSVEYEGTAFHLESVVWSRELVAKPGDRVGLEVDLRHALIDRTGS
jgi:putative spermidine/putrescine transport system ATP-binding protein